MTNSNKCQILCNIYLKSYIIPWEKLLKKTEIEGFKLESADSVILLGLTIRHNLTSDTHIPNICKTARAKNKSLITRLIVIDIAPLMVLFCNCPLADL